MGKVLQRATAPPSIGLQHLETSKLRCTGKHFKTPVEGRDESEGFTGYHVKLYLSYS